jgi:hypothetical protein
VRLAALLAPRNMCQASLGMTMLPFASDMTCPWDVSTNIT